MTREELVKLTGLCRVTIWKVETNLDFHVREETAAVLSRALRCRVEDLFDYKKHISQVGRLPMTGGSAQATVGDYICPHCHQATNPRLPDCYNCGESRAA